METPKPSSALPQHVARVWRRRRYPPPSTVRNLRVGGVERATCSPSAHPGDRLGGGKPKQQYVIFFHGMQERVGG